MTIPCKHNTNINPTISGHHIATLNLFFSAQQTTLLSFRYIQCVLLGISK